MKTWIVLSETTYEKLLNDKELLPDPLVTYFTSHESACWLLKEYELKLGFQVQGLFSGFNFQDGYGNAELLAESYPADKNWLLIQLNIPEDHCLPVNSLAPFHLTTGSPVFSNETESDDFYQRWSLKTQEKLYNISSAMIQDDTNDPFSQQAVFKRMFISEVIQTWSKLLALTPPKNYDAKWSGPFELIPYFHVIKPEWIVNAIKFAGKDWEEWIGPNKVDAETYPLLEGYGDALKIGDSFKCNGTFKNDEVLTMLGWKKREDGLVMMYAESKDQTRVSYAMNPQGGNRTLVKVQNQ